MTKLERQTVDLSPYPDLVCVPPAPVVSEAEYYTSGRDEGRPG